MSFALFAVKMNLVALEWKKEKSAMNNVEKEKTIKFK